MESDTARTAQYREVERLARNGYTAALWSAQIDTDLAATSNTPEIVLINLGTNDIQQLADTIVQATWESDFAYVLDAIHTKWPDAVVKVAQVWRRYNNGQMTDMNDTWIPNVLSTRSAWASLGIDERDFLENGDNGATYTTDGIHPNSAGYRLTWQQWRAVL